MNQQDNAQFESAWDRHADNGFADKERARAIFNAGLYVQAAKGHDTLEIRKAMCFDLLREMLGYVQNGSITRIEIDQDDATKTFILLIGNRGSNQRRYYGNSLEEVVGSAAKAEVE